jgi:hypothetical protein
MQREHHQALTKNYVLLVNEPPVGEVLDELVQNKILDHEMREFICHHPTRKGRTRALFCVWVGKHLHRLFRETHFHVFYVWVGKHLHQIVSLQGQQSTAQIMESFSTSSFHLGGNLYLIAEQDGILLTDKNTMSDIYFPLVRWVQLQTTWGYIYDAVHYLEHNRYTSLDVHLGSNVFVTAESPALSTFTKSSLFKDSKAQQKSWKASRPLLGNIPIRARVRPFPVG